MTVSNEDREAAALALVRHFNPDQLDPAYIAEFERSGLKVPAPVDQSTMVSFVAGDGHRSLRTLTFGEIADFLVSHGWGPRPRVSPTKLGEFIDQANAGGMAVPWRGLQDYLRECGIEVTEK